VRAYAPHPIIVGRRLGRWDLHVPVRGDRPGVFAECANPAEKPRVIGDGPRRPARGRNHVHLPERTARLFSLRTRIHRSMQIVSIPRR